MTTDELLDDIGDVAITTLNFALWAMDKVVAGLFIWIGFQIAEAWWGVK